MLQGQQVVSVVAAAERDSWKVGLLRLLQCFEANDDKPHSGTAAGTHCCLLAQSVGCLEWGEGRYIGNNLTLGAAQTQVGHAAIRTCLLWSQDSASYKSIPSVLWISFN